MNNGTPWKPLSVEKREVVKKFGADPIFSSKGNKKDRKKQKSLEKKLFSDFLFFALFCFFVWFV